MVSIPLVRIKCEICQIKIPKAQPKLFCTICNKLKHLACQKLTKSDANTILYLKIPWTCKECIFQILPVNACSMPKRDKNTSTKKFKLQCSSCNGFCYSLKNVRTCENCERQVHNKCWHHSLGCTKCCEDIIPGFHAYSYELLGDPYLRNNKAYNPYSKTHFTQLIGEMLENQEGSNHAFNQASEILINCKYKVPLAVSHLVTQNLMYSHSM